MQHVRSIFLTGSGLDVPERYAATRRLIELAKAFRDQGFKPVLIPLEASRVPDAPTNGECDSVPYQYLFRKRNVVSGEGFGARIVKRYYVLMASVRLARLIVQSRKDVAFIVCSTTAPSAIVILSAVSALSGVPLLYDVIEDPWSTLISRNFRTLGWKFKIRHVLGFARLPILYLLAWRMPAYIGYITQPMRERLLRLGIRNDRLVPLPILKYGVSEFSGFREETVRESPKHIVYSGSLTFSKDGLDVLVKAFSRVREFDPLVRLRIFGRGDEGEYHNLVRLVHELGLEGSVELAGFVSAPELVQAQRNATLLILLKKKTPQNRYNMATKLIEYLESGVPVLLSDIETHRQYFQEGVNAVFASPDDPDDVAGKIRWVLQNPGKAQAIGCAGRDVLRVHFSAGVAAKEILGRIGL